MKENGGSIMTMKSYSLEEIRKLKDETDWERVRNMSDDDINFSDIPELTDEMAAKGVRYKNGELLEKYFGNQVKVSIESEIVDFFKSMGEDWETRINETLIQAVKFKSIFS